MEIDGYWERGWEGEAQGTTLRRRTGTGHTIVRAPAGVKITDSSPVLSSSCQPAHTLPIVNTAVIVREDPDVATALNVLDDRDLPALTYSLPAPTYTLDSEPDLSFDFSLSLDISLDASLDISLISDTSTSSADDSEGDTSFTLPPPPLGLGLGITGLYNPDGTPFDGMGVLSFGVRSAGASPRRTRSKGKSRDGLSRGFLEELEAT
ncbi:hypothetical protein C8R47DRAFT_1209461 [Mycena vitilis]|nr:hypothetical protein C8R47DRAFT_1209461 [Mycena vitilis]